MAHTTVILVRHGETEWNLAGRFQGQLDSPLTQLGHAQAQAVAQRLHQESFTHLYSSDLGRAYATAQVIAAATGHTVLTDERLREKHGGALQGMTDNEVAQHRREWREQVAQRSPDFAAPGGENTRAVLARTLAFLDEIAERHHGEQVVAVTHGGVLSALLRHILGIPQETHRRFHLRNTSLHTINRNEKGDWWVELLGDARHLSQAQDDTV